jgi:predicted enzyme related to lactoylglutathione lyase
MMSSRTSSVIGGLPPTEVRLKVHFLRTSSRCHLRNVCGLTTNDDHRARGMAVGPKGVVLTVEVDDIAEMLGRAERLGGRRLADVGSEQLLLEGAGSADGTFAIHGFVDPEGNPVQILKR